MYKLPVDYTKMNKRIGIDPDVDKSGVCCIEDGKITELLNLDLSDLFAYIDSKPYHVICIEAGWLNHSIFHFAIKKNVQNQIAERVGANHEIGRQIERYCLKQNRPFKLVRPTAGKWKADMFRKITGWQGRTNQEQRDAVRAAW